MRSSRENDSHHVRSQQGASSGHRRGMVAFGTVAFGLGTVMVGVALAITLSYLEFGSQGDQGVEHTQNQGRRDNYLAVSRSKEGSLRLASKNSTSKKLQPFEPVSVAIRLGIKGIRIRTALLKHHGFSLSNGTMVSLDLVQVVVRVGGKTGASHVINHNTRRSLFGPTLVVQGSPNYRPYAGARNNDGARFWLIHIGQMIDIDVSGSSDRRRNSEQLGDYAVSMELKLWQKKKSNDYQQNHESPASSKTLAWVATQNLASSHKLFNFEQFELIDSDHGQLPLLIDNVAIEFEHVPQIYVKKKKEKKKIMKET